MVNRSLSDELRRVVTNGDPASGKSATIRESNHGSGVCKEHYA